MSKKILLIYGPSGAGKTVSGGLLESWGVPRLVTNTTRDPKNGEISGVHYHFVSKSEFSQLDLVEFTEYDTNYYGISKAELSDKWQKSDLAFAVTDINGVLAFKEKYPDQTLALYVVAPLQALEQRMFGRGDTKKQVSNRLKNVEESKEFNNLYLADYVIVNNEWKTTVAMLNVVMQSAQGSLVEY
jgi:guanylate kinase